MLARAAGARAVFWISGATVLLYAAARFVNALQGFLVAFA